MRQEDVVWNRRTIAQLQAIGKSKQKAANGHVDYIIRRMRCTCTKGDYPASIPCFDADI
jgi:hypothetical protein